MRAPGVTDGVAPVTPGVTDAPTRGVRRTRVRGAGQPPAGVSATARRPSAGMVRLLAQLAQLPGLLLRLPRPLLRAQRVYCGHSAFRSSSTRLSSAAQPDVIADAREEGCEDGWDGPGEDSPGCVCDGGDCDGGDCADGGCAGGDCDPGELPDGGAGDGDDGEPLPDGESLADEGCEDDRDDRDDRDD